MLQVFGFHKGSLFFLLSAALAVLNVDSAFGNPCVKMIQAEHRPTLARAYPQGSSADTIIMSRDGKIRSIHGHEIPFIRDAEILEVFRLSPELIAGDVSGKANPIRYRKSTYNEKAVFQQVGHRGCTAGVTAMLILDRGGRLDYPAIYMRNLGIEKDMIQDLKNAGLSPISIRIDNRVDLISKAISETGPVIVGVSGELGGHVIIVDAIHLLENYAVIRDPYHGWQIKISLKALQSRLHFSEYAIGVQ